MLFAISCGSDKLDDSTPPTISDVRFNVNDTIQYDDNGVKKFLTLNDSLKDLSETDTLVIGKRLRFTGHFADDLGLSTAFFHIWGDTLTINDENASYNMKRLMPIYMYGQTEMTVVAPGIILADPLPFTVKSKDMQKDLTVRSSSATEKYYFSIRCSDTVGNIDSTSYRKHPITLLTRAQVIAIAKATPESKE